MIFAKVKQSLIDADGGKLLAQMEADGKVVLDIDGQSVELDSEDVQVRLQVIGAVARLGDVETLSQALGDADAAVRATAGRAFPCPADARWY